MKKGVFKLITVLLALAVIFSCVFSVSAAKYPTVIVSDSIGYNGFKQPGDVDGNGKIEKDDFVSTQKVLLGISELDIVLTDANGDGETDICDLVFQNEQDGSFVNDTQLTFNGRSVYHDDLNLTSGVEYEVKNLGTATLELKINGEPITIENDKFKTPYNVDDVKLSVIGKDITVDSLQIYRINMDNDVAVG